MTPEEWVAAIRSESAPLAALDPSKLDLRVPSCPGWDLADLFTHIGWVLRFWAFVAELPEGEKATKEKVIAAGIGSDGQRPDADLVPWLQASVDRFLDGYGRQPAGKIIESRYWGPQPVSLLARRMAHELLIHRWDFEQALGQPSTFDPALAADGVDEFLEIWVPMLFKEDRLAKGGTVAVEATDCDARWLISVEGGATKWQHGSGEADVIGRATAGELDLFLWGRVHVDQLDVGGDADVLSSWQRAASA